MDTEKWESKKNEVNALYIKYRQLAITNKGLIIEKLCLAVADDGKTLVSDDGTEIEAAMEWNDLGYFLDFLTDTYCNFQK